MNPWQSQPVLRERHGSPLTWATNVYLSNPNLFCKVCSHISINKQALTLPVVALNALLHCKHGNELVTWKVLSLTWTVHVQRGKKKPTLTNTIISAGISLSPSLVMKQRPGFCFKAESYHSFKSFKKHRPINTSCFFTAAVLTLSHWYNWHWKILPFTGNTQIRAQVTRI